MARMKSKNFIDSSPNTDLHCLSGSGYPKMYLLRRGTPVKIGENPGNVFGVKEMMGIMPVVRSASLTLLQTERFVEKISRSVTFDRTTSLGIKRR
jgi:hypothetical protein